MRSVIVAFSGGVDSAYLAWAATEVLGRRALCITAESPSYPAHHRQLALRVAREFALHHEMIFTGEIERPEYRANPENRCYFCKTRAVCAADRNRARAWVCARRRRHQCRRSRRLPARPRRGEAVRRPKPARRSRADEGGRYVSSRALAGLPVWDEPASACLSSRIPYHHEVTPEKLRQIERGEEALHALGFRVCRVRHHDTLARVEAGTRRAAARPRARHA